MKFLIVGGNGTIGKRVVSHFKNKNEIIIAGRTNGDVTVDIANSDSLTAMFEHTGKLDAIICMAGEAKMEKVVNGYMWSVKGKGNEEIIPQYFFIAS